MSDAAVPADADASVPPDSGSLPSVNVHSGTRLKAEWDRYEDGTRQSSSTIRDSLLDVDCGATQGSDGSLYCLPIFSGVYYADAACSQPVMLSSSSLDAPLYAAVFATNTFPPECPATVRPATTIYERGVPLGAAEFWVANDDGTCSGPETIPSYQLYALGADVAEDAFQSLAVGAPVGSGRFPMRYLESADGFSAPWQFHDASNDVDCSLLGELETYPQSGASSIACRPSSYPVAFSKVFSDEGCTDVVISAGITGCPVPPGVGFSQGCPGTVGDYYAVGAAVGSAELYAASGSACELVSQSTSYYSVGSALDLGELPRAVQTVAGRRMANIDVDGLMVTYPSVLYDSTLGAECTTMLASDGALRCLPTTSAEVDTRGWYSDAACRNALDLIFFERESTTCSSVAPTYAYAWNEGVTNGAGVHVVGALYTGKMYYADGSADCAENVGDVNLYYQDGAIVPATSFAPATLMIDP